MTPNAIPLSRANAFSQIATALDQAGASPERLTRRLNIPNWHHARPDDFVPMEHDYRLLHFGAKAVGDPLFGATVMEHVPIQHRRLLCTYIQNNPNLYQSLQTFVWAVGIYGTSRRWWIAEHPDDIWLYRGGSLVFELGEIEMEQLALVAMVQIVRMAAGPNWRPGKILGPDLKEPGAREHRDLRQCRNYPRCDRLRHCHSPIHPMLAVRRKHRALLV